MFHVFGIVYNPEQRIKIIISSRHKFQHLCMFCVLQTASHYRTINILVSEWYVTVWLLCFVASIIFNNQYPFVIIAHSEVIKL